MPTIFFTLKALREYCKDPSNSLEDVIIDRSITSLKGLFKYSNRTNDQFKGIEKWDVSHIKNMEGLFAFSRFNRDISGWNTSRVTDMSYMFFKAENFNQPIGSWNVSKVTDMRDMFSDCSAFNGDISQWDVSLVTNMRGMFYSCSSFNSDLSKWKVSQVEHMSCMFSDCSSFNSDLSKWDVSQVINMCFMFYGCSSFNSDLSKWNVSNVTDMKGMFYCSSFNGDISNWDVSNVKDVSSMFELSAFNQNINNWKLDLENINYECFAVRGDLTPENYPVVFREYNPELFEFEDDITQEEEQKAEELRSEPITESFKAYRNYEDRLKKLFASALTN